MATSTEPKQSDQALMIRAQGDDAGAFAQLYSRHAVRALRVAHAVCHDRGRAEEAVQEAFLSIWRNRANFRPDSGSFQAWSMRIVHNRAIDLSRSAAVARQAQIDAIAGTKAAAAPPSPQEEVIARSENEALWASLQQLPDAQAEVIALAFFGGLSHAEIAAQLDLPQGTVKGRMRLGLEKLRARLQSPG